MTINTLPENPTLSELALVAHAFAPSLSDANLRDLLAYLNGMTQHRFTGIYRFTPGWVMSIALHDRENPAVQIGANVKMKESYCWLTGLGDGYIIEDARVDARLSSHAARDEVRSYVAVLLRDRMGTPWGTLCHFDFGPQVPLPDAMQRLLAFRPLLEEVLVRDSVAQWQPDAPSVGGKTLSS